MSVRNFHCFFQLRIGFPKLIIQSKHSAFLNTLKKILSRRGHPCIKFSVNVTNCKGTTHKLNELYQFFTNKTNLQIPYWLGNFYTKLARIAKFRRRNEILMKENNLPLYFPLNKKIKERHEIDFFSKKLVNSVVFVK